MQNRQERRHCQYFRGVYHLTAGIDSAGCAVNCPGVTLDLGIKLLGQSAMTFPLCIQDQTPIVFHFNPPGSGLCLSWWGTDSRVRGHSVQTMVSKITVKFQQIQKYNVLNMEKVI